MFKTLTAMVLGLMISAPSFADGQWDTSCLPGSNFSLSRGETHSLYVDGWRHIQKLYVQAEAYGCDATVEVMVNGEAKGTIYLPGRDPSYVVTIAEAANSIEFRHVTGCNAHIREVKAVQSATFVRGYAPKPGFGGGFGNGFSRPGYGSEVARIANDAIGISDMFRDYVLPTEYMTYILPIKKVAGRLFVQVTARGELSGKTRDAMAALKAQIDLASAYLDQSLERNATFDLAVELMTLSNRLDDLLN